MLLKELISLKENVINASFGKRKGVMQDTGIEVPAGYDRFEVDYKEGELMARIIGIKGNKKTIISRAHLPLAQELVKTYNQGGLSDSGLKPLTWMQAFGSDEMNALHDVGIELTEKPDGFEAFETGGYAAKNNIHQIALKKVEKVLGGKLKEYTAKEIFGTDSPRGTLVDANLPKEPMCIIKLGNGNRYLVDTTQARSYIRMWQKIV